MSNVSANIGANTQQAESSIGRLLASLRKLRQESATGVGMKMFASDEVNKLSSALNQAIAAAGALNKLDLSQFDSSLRRSAELLKRNADNYLRAQQAMGNQGVAGRFAQHLGAGGNPLNPDFGKMFPGMQGAALQRQMDYYFKSMLRGTGMSGSFSGGGGRGGTTGHGGAAPGGGGEGDGGGSTAILAGLGKMLAPILAAVSVGKLVSSGLAAARRNTEAEDTLMRMTRDGGTGAGIGRAGLRMDNQVGSLSEHFEFIGKRYGLSGTEAMQSAQVYAHAAQQNDRQSIGHGLNASAGFARAYGLNINQTAGGLGGLQRTGAIGSTPAAQNEFLLKMAQVLKGTGMTANADQAIDDLAQTVDQYISHDLATPSAGKLDEFSALRAVTYAMPGLSGQHGQGLLQRFDENMRSDGNDARNVMMATALQSKGISNPYTQRRIQAEGANFRMKDAPGWTGEDITYGEFAANEAHRIAQEAANQGGGTGFDRDSMELSVMGNLLNESIPGAHKMYDIYQQRRKDQATLVDSKAQLARYGLTPESFSNTSGVKDAVDLMGMDNPEDVREVAKRYADRLDMTGEGGAARADINKLLEDANSDPEAIKKRTLEAIAQFGQHGSQTTTDRASQAEQDNALNAVGRVFMDEWNTTVETGSIALKDFARSTDGAKKALDAFKDWLNAMLATTPTGELPLGHTRPPEMGLPVDLPLMPGETQAERDAGGTVPPLRPFGSPPPGTGGGTPTTGNPLLNWLVPPANANVTPTPVRNWNLNPGIIPPDIANTSPMPTAPNRGATGGAAASTTSLDATSGHVQARDIYDYLVNEKGVSPSKAVAVVTNIEAESGFKVNTVHDGGTGYGLFGHRDPNGKSGRRSALFKHAGTQTPSAKQQLDYLVTESEWKQFDAVDNGGDHRADTASFTKIVESPKDENLRAQERAAKSDNYASYMGSGPASGPAPPIDTGGKAPASPAVDMSGLNIDDQSDPNFGYGESATANAQPFKGIVFHHTSSDSLQNEVAYGKTKDAKRGGAFGYHYYIGQDGEIVQGAPLDKRTNHIKPGSKTGLSNKDSMGISLVGAKDGATPKQLAAAKLLGESVMASNSIDPKNIYGHGEMQKDRMAHEGVAAADQLRKANPKAPADTGAPTATAKSEDTPAITPAVANTGASPDTVVATAAGVTKPAVPADTGAAQKGIDNPNDTLVKDIMGPRRDTGALQPGADPDNPIGTTTEADRDKVRAERDAAKAAAAGAHNKEIDAAQRLPPAPDGSDARSQGFIPNPPGDQQVDPKAKETITATQTKNFGELQVNVNNYQNGVKQSTSSQTLKAGSGGADNSVKGAVNISPEKAA